MKSSNDSDGPQWKHSLFGNPNDTETFRSVLIAPLICKINYQKISKTILLNRLLAKDHVACKKNLFSEVLSIL